MRSPLESVGHGRSRGSRRGGAAPSARRAAPCRASSAGRVVAGDHEARGRRRGSPGTRRGARRGGGGPPGRSIGEPRRVGARACPRRSRRRPSSVSTRKATCPSVWPGVRIQRTPGSTSPASPASGRSVARSRAAAPGVGVRRRELGLVDVQVHLAELRQRRNVVRVQVRREDGADVVGRQARAPRGRRRACRPGSGSRGPPPPARARQQHGVGPGDHAVHGVGHHPVGAEGAGRARRRAARRPRPPSARRRSGARGSGPPRARSRLSEAASVRAGPVARASARSCS